jgi:hypothetical protein
MKEFMSELPPIAPVDTTLNITGGDLTEESRQEIRSGVMVNRYIKRDELESMRWSKNVQLCGLILRNLSSDVKDYCSLTDGWRTAMDNFDFLYIWRTVRDLWSTPSNSHNPMERERVALETFMRTRQHGDLAEYILQFGDHLRCLSAEQRQAFTEQEIARRFIMGLNPSRFANLIDRYAQSLFMTPPGYANHYQAMQAASREEERLNNKATRGALDSRGNGKNQRKRQRR